MNHFINFAVGIFIGTGLILPGVSGAVLAIAFGVYDKLLYSISNFFSDIKKNLLFLTPIMLGLVVGTFAFGKILLYLFENYPNQTKASFVGLILGSLPIIFNKLKVKKGQYDFKFPAFTLALCFGLLLFISNEFYTINEPVSVVTNSVASYFKLFIAGILYSLGKIVPGVSSSFLLMLLGVYEYVLNLIANPMLIFEGQLVNALFFIAGFGLGLIVLSKLILKLLTKYPLYTYSAVIGFILGSILIIFPSLSLSVETLIAISLFGVMFFVSYQFSLYENNKEKKI